LRTAGHSPSNKFDLASIRASVRWAEAIMRKIDRAFPEYRAGLDYVSVCQAKGKSCAPLPTTRRFSWGNGGPFPSVLEGPNSKSLSNLIAKAKSPVSFCSVRTTLPRPHKKVPGRERTIPTDSSTADPSGIRKALESKIPARPMLSDWAYSSLWASLSETGSCSW